MKWIVKLVAEPTPGQMVEQEIVVLEREALISPATVGLSISEGKQILENLQKQMVATQVQQHNASLKFCLSIRDNGRGFDPAFAGGTAQGHFGLQGMRGRVEQAGGCFTVWSAPGQGTEVRAEFLLESRNSRANWLKQ